MTRIALLPYGRRIGASLSALKYLASFSWFTRSLVYSQLAKKIHYLSRILSIWDMGTYSMLQINVVIRTYTEVEAVLCRLSTVEVQGRNPLKSMWYLCWSLLGDLCDELPSQNVIPTWILIWVSLMTEHLTWFRIMLLNSCLPRYYTLVN